MFVPIVQNSSMMNQNYISLLEAEKLTGKSRATLTRLAHKYPKQSQRIGKKILISKKLVIEKCGILETKMINQDESLTNHLQQENQFLRQQIALKDTEIEQLLQIITNLSSSKKPSLQNSSNDESQTIKEDDISNHDSSLINQTKTQKYGEDIINQAIQLHQQGINKAEIARRLDVPRSTIRGWLKSR